MNPSASVRADRDQNCLYVTVEGFFDVDAAKTAADDVTREVAKLTRGFSVINDISQLKAASEEVAEEIERLLRVIDKAGAAKVFRVITQEATIAKLQHARLQRKTGVSYTVVEVGSVEEAEQQLDLP